MDYTDKQYEVMRMLNSGLIYYVQSPENQTIIRYLQDEGIAQSRADIADFYYELSETGKRVLEEHQRQESVRAENVRKEQEEKQQKLEQIAADKAERKAEQRTERIFQIFLAIIQVLLPFLVGLIAEHFFDIIDCISALFSNLLKFHLNF